MTAEKATSKKNDFEKALAVYTKALKVFQSKDDPKAKEALEAFIESFPQERELVDRANMLLKVIENRMSPPTPPLKTSEDYYVNGIFQMNLGLLEQAINSFEKAVSKDPKLGKALYALADACCLQKNFEGCLENLQQAVKLDASFGILAQNETDFDPIKDDPRFDKIINPA